MKCLSFGIPRRSMTQRTSILSGFWREKRVILVVRPSLHFKQVPFNSLSLKKDATATVQGVCLVVIYCDKPWEVVRLMPCCMYSLNGRRSLYLLPRGVALFSSQFFFSVSKSPFWSTLRLLSTTFRD